MVLHFWLSLSFGLTGLAAVDLVAVGFAASDFAMTVDVETTDFVTEADGCLD